MDYYSSLPGMKCGHCMVRGHVSKIRADLLCETCGRDFGPCFEILAAASVAKSGGTIGEWCASE